MLAIPLLISLLALSSAHGKEIAFSFDDAPVRPSSELLQKLKSLKLPSATIFANACKREDTESVIKQLKAYRDAGHLIGNHTCTHPRLDNVGFEAYSQDAMKGDRLLAPLFNAQKFFRFPFLNEGTDPALRDQMRGWLNLNHYRNGMVSIDNDDYLFTSKINQAKKLSSKIDYAKVEKLFLSHLLGAVEFYDDLAMKTIGRSPKHVLLLHEMDATVMFLDSLVAALRARGWTIISADDAFQDPLYLEQPKNTYANNGILAQLAFEKSGVKTGYFKFEELKAELDKILGL